MIHNIFGDIGAGKSVFLVRTLSEIYFNRGQELLERSQRIIDEENKSRNKKLTLPKKVPIYCNFKVQIQNSDGSIYEPYFIKGSEIGIGKNYKKIYPCSVIFIDEAQCEFNSKDNLKRAVSEFFEKCRHADYDIWIASQRPILINKDIRDLSRHFIQINSLEKIQAHFGIICGLKWLCREFNSRADVEEYVELSKHGKADIISYKETVYESGGEILDYYDSKTYLKDYLPEEGNDYV